ncbi:MAG TPA: hypothetical protein VNQ76_19545, partial [Planctomicrobium sp.]|nr:hypothetical protein [Planctomicrobium sp.]
MRTLAVILTVLTFLSPGCSQERRLPTPVQVTGTITFEGKPVDSVNVLFAAISEGLPGKYRYAEAKTNASGEYTVPKIYPAEYMVQVIKVDPSAAPADAEQGPAVPLASAEFAPYGSESPLRAVVNSDATQFDFELKS